MTEPPAAPTTAAAAEAGAAAKRPAPQQQPHRPAKFRRVAQPEGQQHAGQVVAPGQQQDQQHHHQHQHQQQHQQPADTQGSIGSAERMEVDPLSPRKRGADEGEAAAGGAGPQVAPPSPAEFLAKLEERMQASLGRSAGPAPSPWLQLLPLLPGALKWWGVGWPLDRLCV